jgi:hypothetical protein
LLSFRDRFVFNSQGADSDADSAELMKKALEPENKKTFEVF